MKITANFQKAVAFVTTIFFLIFTFTPASLTMAKGFKRDGKGTESSPGVINPDYAAGIKNKTADIDFSLGGTQFLTVNQYQQPPGHKIYAMFLNIAYNSTGTITDDIITVSYRVGAEDPVVVTSFVPSFNSGDPTIFRTFSVDLTNSRAWTFDDLKVLQATLTTSQIGDADSGVVHIDNLFSHTNTENNQPNNAPIASNAVVSPVEPTASDNLTGSYSFVDADDDMETGSVITWFQNDVQVPGLNGVLQVPSASTQGGDTWYFKVKPFDGLDYGTEVKSNTVTIAEVPNLAPVLGAIGAQNVLEDSNISFVVTATDVDNDELTFSATDLPVGATFDAETQNFSWTPTYEQSGSYFVTFQVTDGSLSDEEIVEVTVTNVNRVPLLNPIGAKEGKEGSLLTFTVGGSDADGDVLSFSINPLPAGATFNTATGEFYWVPSYEQFGEYNVTFGITDGNLSGIEELITISIANENQPPVLQLIGNKITSEGSTLEFTLVGSDPDGDILSFGAAPLPEGALFDSSNGAFSWTPTFGQNGNFGIKFEVTDGVLNDSEEITISVGDVNRAPQIVAAPELIIGNENEILEYTVSASDPDGDVLTFSAENLPEGASFNSASGVLTWTTSFANSGTYEGIKFTATDGELSSFTTTIIKINNINRAPVLNLIGSKVGQEESILNFTATASDEDLDGLIFSVDGLPDGASFNTISGAFAWTPAVGQNGERSLTFTVTDGDLSASEVVALTISAKEVPPVDPPPVVPPPEVIPPPSSPGGGSGGNGSGPQITAPIISNLVITTMSDGVSLTWNTNVPATTSVQFGKSTTYENNLAPTDGATRKTEHAAIIPNSMLEATSLYHVRVVSSDVFGGTAYSDDNTFATGDSAEYKQPEISGNPIETETEIVEGIGADDVPETSEAGEESTPETFTDDVNRVEMEAASLAEIPSRSISTTVNDNEDFEFLATEEVEVADDEDQGLPPSTFQASVLGGTGAIGNFVFDWWWVLIIAALVVYRQIRRKKGTRNKQ